MVRALAIKKFGDGLNLARFAGLSSDSKPTEDLVTGSEFVEVDTGCIYAFDEETGEWFLMKTGNGKTSIAGATVTLGASPAYDGTEKTQSVSSVKIGSTTLTEDTDYKVVNNTGVGPGSYVLHIVGIGSYCGVIAEDWTITKATGSVTASPDELSLTEDGDNGESTLTVVGDGAVSVSSSDGTVCTASLSGSKVTVKPVGAGSATVTVTLGESILYTGGTDTISVTVAAEEEPEPEPEP